MATTAFSHSTFRLIAIAAMLAALVAPRSAFAARPYIEQLALANEANRYVSKHSYQAGCQSFVALENASDKLTALDPQVSAVYKKLVFAYPGGVHGLAQRIQQQAKAKRFSNVCVLSYVFTLGLVGMGQRDAAKELLDAAHVAASDAGVRLDVASADRTPHAASGGGAPASRQVAAREAGSKSTPLRTGGDPPVGSYTCYTGASAAFVDPLGGPGSKAGTGIRFTPGQFNGYVYILPNNRYAGGYSEADKAKNAAFHMRGSMLVADGGYWATAGAIVRYDTSQGVPTIFVGYKDVQGVNGCQLR
ncbi:MAG: hypothetical protein NVSMB21_20530 [Vulcanimicrobiaceae bacterium]